MILVLFLRRAHRISHVDISHVDASPSPTKLSTALRDTQPHITARRDPFRCFHFCSGMKFCDVGLARRYKGHSLFGILYRPKFPFVYRATADSELVRNE